MRCGAAATQFALARPKLSRNPTLGGRIRVSRKPKIDYWQEGGDEVDFIAPQSGCALAMEVRTGRSRGNISSMDIFCAPYPCTGPMAVGTVGIALESRFAA